MDYRLAVFVREIERGERIEEIVDEAKGRTWTSEVEHALVRVASGERWLVSGGRDGLSFIVRSEGDERSLYVSRGGHEFKVTRVIGHTHPQVTGPSDDDLNALRILGQKRSYLFEINGGRNGTLIRPKPVPGST